MPTAWAPEVSKPELEGIGANAWLVYNRQRSGRGAVWLARLNGVQEVAGSNPVAPTLKGHSSGMMGVPFLVPGRAIPSFCNRLQLNS